ncbi:MAG: DUF4652 domain-containing protein [Candidatus Sumerlaeia bacterium]|nr:DUF4652 domain-containing protein [Candidatus Sumerlaeia bacterium]
MRWTYYRRFAAFWLIGAFVLGTGCAHIRPRVLRAKEPQPAVREVHALPIPPDVDFAQALDLGNGRRLFYSQRDLLYADGDQFYPIVVQGFPRLVGVAPGGQAVAFLDPFEFEMAADLYVFDLAARSLRRLTEHRDSGSTLSVKTARWHDSRTLYYLEGYRYGTVSRGGDLWMVDTQSGERRRVVRAMGIAERFEEIVEFEFVPGAKLIRYVVARHEEDGSETRRARYCTLEGKSVE